MGDVPTQVRIRTEDNPHRYCVIQDAAERWDENMTAAVIDGLEAERDLRDAVRALIRRAESDGPLDAATIAATVDDELTRTTLGVSYSSEWCIGTDDE